MTAQQHLKEAVDILESAKLKLKPLSLGHYAEWHGRKSQEIGIIQNKLLYSIEAIKEYKLEE